MTAQLLCGDVREMLRTLLDESVQCVVTSPPYWGLRDYGTVGQLGLEPTPAEYVTTLVDVFREVRRVLRPDGTLWLNLGDAYSHPTSGGGGAVDARTDGRKTTPGDKVRGRMGGANTMVAGFAAKQLLGIPWRVAFALQDDGWWLRSDIIWHKPNPMPESVTDRPTRSHEYLFLLTKRATYYYDAGAIREAGADTEHTRARYQYAPSAAPKHDSNDDTNIKADDFAKFFTVDGKRNKRTVWTIATQPYSEAHFATFPEKLVEPCVLAGSREGDTILDPFSGSGTVGVVALRRGRSFIGIDLNAEYIEMARRRIHGDCPMFNEVNVA